MYSEECVVTKYTQGHLTQLRNTAQGRCRTSSKIGTPLLANSALRSTFFRNETATLLTWRTKTSSADSRSPTPPTAPASEAPQCFPVAPCTLIVSVECVGHPHRCPPVTCGTGTTLNIQDASFLLCPVRRNSAVSTAIEYSTFCSLHDAFLETLLDHICAMPKMMFQCEAFTIFSVFAVSVNTVSALLL